jgi:hypothetical protein
VDNAKLSNMAQSTLKGRATASTGDPEDLSASQVRTILNVADGATANTASTATPSALGTAAAGTSTDFARGDHVHSAEPSDSAFRVVGSSDATKKVAFEVDTLVDTATTRTLTVPNASGTLPLLETANTYTQNQTLDGTNNTAPNQTAASGSSVMTRDLTDDAIFRRWNRWAIYENFNFKTAELTTIGGTASPSSTTGNADIPAWSYRPNNVVDAANNYQALVGPYAQLSSGTSRTIKNWSKRSVLALRILHVASGGTTRYYWGPQASNWAGGALAVRGIGFEIVNNSLVATCHNGTSKTTASSGVTLSNLILYNLLIESDGAGGVRWYVDGAEQTALTGGPTGNSGSSQYGFCTEAVNPTPAAGTFVAIQNLMLASAL